MKLPESRLLARVVESLSGHNFRIARHPTTFQQGDAASTPKGRGRGGGALKVSDSAILVLATRRRAPASGSAACTPQRFFFSVQRRSGTVVSMVMRAPPARLFTGAESAIPSGCARASAHFHCGEPNFSLARIPSLAPHPVQTNGQPPRYDNLGDPPAPLGMSCVDSRTSARWGERGREAET